ncbi:MAG: helix-hairpin-helix domain-containing protein [Bacteroidales bacterium]|nr:helix-hairpin-helix domain-containing protein [Bacteroidales bacterium]
MSLRHLLFVILLTCSATLLLAQNDDDAAWREMLEQWAEQNDSETVPDGLLEQLQDYRTAPINLNDTHSTALLDLPFITEFQADVIKAYIEQNGEMVTLGELYLLNGFDPATVRLLSYFVTVAPVEKQKQLSLKKVLTHGRSNLVVGGRTTVPRSRGYDDSSYVGSPYRLYFRYLYKYSDRVAFQLSADKDPGEAFGGAYNPQGFDYYGYYLMLNNFGILRHAIVGKYQLQFGQGLTLWSGFAPWMLSSKPFWRYGQGIRPASAFCEYGYLNGAAATLDMGRHTELTLFYSFVRRDATTQTAIDSLGNATNYFQSLYNSGYHRSELEMAKEDLLGEHFTGARVQYRRTHLMAGATATWLLLNEPITPASYVYNTFAFAGRHVANAGMDVSYRYRRMLLFGEVASSWSDSTEAMMRRSDFVPLAAVAGAQLNINTYNTLSVAYRYGSPIYHNLHACGIGQHSSVQNEEGLGLFLTSRLPYAVDMQASADIFRYPWMRYRVYSPSTGYDFRVKLTREVVQHTQLSVQYRYRSEQRNSDARLRYTERTGRQQLQWNLDFVPTDDWRLQTRVMHTWFSCEDHDSERGFLISQEVTYHPVFVSHPYSLGVRLALFDVSAYDARLFLYENDLMYEYGVPMLTGQGLRCHLVYRQTLTPSLSVAFKCAVAYYPDATTLGSGHDQIDGNCRADVKLQLRWKF